MAQQESSLRLQGEIEQVRHACEFVVNFAHKAGLGDDSVFQCQLAIEEIFTNIVEHGYQHNGTDKSIEIACLSDGDKIFISITDEAPPFNPLELESPDTNASLWERGNGGWGVHFVRKFMDDIQYRLHEGRNQLILEKDI